jgi:predicted RNase H-like HicB family nuclease
MGMRYFPALIVQDAGESEADGFGVVFPDLPGCTSDGATMQEAAVMAAEALALHIEGMREEGERIPEPSAPGRVPDWLGDGSTIITSVLVPVEMPGKAVRINVTMDEALVQRLDAAAAVEGNSRSGYLAQAVRERLQRGRGQPESS